MPRRPKTCFLFQSTEGVNYQRNIKRALRIYRVTFVLLLVSGLAIVVLKAYAYLSLLVFAYFIRDVIFPIHFVSVHEAVLRVKRFLLGGLFIKSFIIECNRIIEVTNIDAGITVASELSFEYGIFSGGDGTDQKRFELYRIKYADEAGVEMTRKIPLTVHEAVILNGQLRTSSALAKQG